MAKLAFIGMGEAGAALITGWGVGAHDIVAFDRKTECAATRDAMLARYQALGVAGAESLAAAVAGAEIILSVVTADQAQSVAEAAAPHLRNGSFFCDLNSCAPGSKQASDRMVSAAAGRYVDVAVMAPVHPSLNRVPMLISGPHAQAVSPLLRNFPLNFREVPGAVGRASTIKMVRSVLIKGLEALTAEFMLAVKAADVADEVLPSLAKNYPGFDWDEQATYNFERAMVHGARRAAEMAEVVKTLEALGLPSRTTQATVEWEAALASTGVAPPEDPSQTDAMQMAEQLLPHFQNRT